MVNKKAIIFLCYAKPDRESVMSLYDKLVDIGYEPWMDEKNILPGEFWSSSIRRAIRRSDFFLACISKNSITRRGYLQKEIKEGLEIWKEKLEDDIYLIPVRFEECELPQNLASFQCLDLFQAGGITLLVDTITEGLNRRRERSGRHSGAGMLGNSNDSYEKPAKPEVSIASKKIKKDAVERSDLRACGLFGGQDAIIKRMTQFVQKKLLGMPMEKIMEMEKDLSLPTGLLHNIAIEGETVDLDLFHCLSGPLGILFYEALGTPVFDRQERIYWENEQTKKPILIASAVGGTPRGRKEIIDIELEFYVKLRALTELAQV